MAAVAAALYEVVALLVGWPPITDVVWHWRVTRNPLALLVFATWAALGWHLFVELHVKR